MRSSMPVLGAILLLGAFAPPALAHGFTWKPVPERVDPGPEAAACLVALAAPDQHPRVREAAVLGLGVAGDRSDGTSDRLLGILEDPLDSSGCRSLAAVSLGLLGDADARTRRALRASLDAGEADADLPCSALLALGLLGEPRNVPLLMDLVRTPAWGPESFPDRLRGGAILALGRFGDPSIRRDLVPMLRMRGRFTLWSTFVALGRTIPNAAPEDARNAVAAIVRSLKYGSDVRSNCLALLALGRIAGSRDTDDAARDSATHCPRDRVLRSRDGYGAAPFALFGLALAARDRDERTAWAIRGTLRVVRAPGFRRRHLELPASLALFLIGEESERAGLRDLLPARSADEPALLARMTAPRATLFDVVKCAPRLAEAGGEASVARLLAILEPGAVEGRYPDFVRGVAAAALGRLLDPRPVPVLARIRTDGLYGVSIPLLERLMEWR